MTRFPFAYSVYGLDVRSNLALPGLRAGTGRGVPLEVEAEEAREFPVPPFPPHYALGFESLWHFPDGRWLLRYGTDTDTPPWSIEGRCGSPRLELRWCVPSQLLDIPSVLAGPGFATFLQMQDAFVFHASVIGVAGRAVLIIGTSGAGKSTAAAAMIAGGHKLISDDLAVLDANEAGLDVRAGPSRMRLYADSARAAGLGEELPRLFHHPVFDDKRYVDLDASPDDSTPVAAIYLLQPRQEGLAAPHVERLAPRSALSHLLPNIYRAGFLDAVRARKAAERCAWIAGKVPVLAVHRPDSLSALPEVVSAIAGSATAVG